MSDRVEIELDAALEELVADVAAATPRPGTDLTARVLADAAAVAAQNVAVAEPVVETAAPAARLSLRDLLFGWTAGATAAAALALVVGITVGMQVDTNLPMMVEEETEEVGLFADSGFLPDDFL